MFLFSRLLLCLHVIATRTCVLAQQLMDAKGRKRGPSLLPLVRVKTHDDPDQSLSPQD